MAAETQLLTILEHVHDCIDTNAYKKKSNHERKKHALCNVANVLSKSNEIKVPFENTDCTATSDDLQEVCYTCMHVNVLQWQLLMIDPNRSVHFRGPFNCYVTQMGVGVSDFLEQIVTKV